MKRKFEKRVFELTVVGFIAMVVAMMIIPLAPWMMDVLISVNLSVSMLIFCLALLKKNPLHFNAFPVVLLIATLFRLSLNISSTRLILTRADAGRIIAGFGGYVVGGDIIVGAVIFGIILMVLFLVITKGAERVAEVAARFTLDALPGMQMAIETDVKTRTISPSELKAKRTALEQRSMYYGSLDGAMKFVRGDAVAALVITAINLIGGILVGVLRKGMPVGDALNLYGRLTVGDGLVTMIPALFISTAAGILVTRIAQGESSLGLAEQVGNQFASEPKALLAAAAMMTLLAFAPGLPWWPFAMSASVLIGLVFFSRAQSTQKEKESSETAQHAQDSHVLEQVSIDRMQHLLDELAQRHPVLVREAVWGRISLPYLADIVTEMKLDGIGEQSLGAILEALARVKIVDDIDEMLVMLRKRMPHVITRSLKGCSLNEDTQLLKAVTLDWETEQLIESSISPTQTGKKLVLPPDLFEEFYTQINAMFSVSKSILLVTSPQIRRPLQRFVSMEFPSVWVVGHGELFPTTQIDIESKLSL